MSVAYDVLNDDDTYHHGNLRDELIDTAVDVIGREGVAALSLRALARDLGVSHSAPTRHFKNKAELLSAIMEEAYEDMLTTTVDAGYLAGDNPVHRLRAMARACMRWHVDNRALSEVIRNPDVSRTAGRNVKEVLAAFYIHSSRAILGAQGQSRNPDRPVEFVYLSMIVSVVGAASVLTDPVYVETLPALDADELIDDMVDHLFPLKDG